MTEKIHEGQSPAPREEELVPREDDSQRAFPLAAAALIAVLLLAVLLTINWVC